MFEDCLVQDVVGLSGESEEVEDCLVQDVVGLSGESEEGVEGVEEAIGVVFEDGVALDPLSDIAEIALDGAGVFLGDVGDGVGMRLGRSDKRPDAADGEFSTS